MKQQNLHPLSILIKETGNGLDGIQKAPGYISTGKEQLYSTKRYLVIKSKKIPCRKVRATAMKVIIKSC